MKSACSSGTYTAMSIRTNSVASGPAPCTGQSHTNHTTHHINTSTTHQEIDESEARPQTVERQGGVRQVPLVVRLVVHVEVQQRELRQDDLLGLKHIVGVPAEAEPLRAAWLGLPWFAGV